ncbi:malonyl-CoA:anthocyanidin 5-O-glucoside-6''-O-malonyltransferase-like [Mangifera indica]|uniref:malonyl-CoA:anthocyanidin 5-O-glucoside-6''-O-malonyltransferase-like n=1 Tax=Mangifera indica TaxID=29780 RepID=UPI001CFAAA58|nr:malonyl-CoA:anthocyanidin 5-O-glucoside-6''-O-malonyltransferase-like [Mangifera indica]
MASSTSHTVKIQEVTKVLPSSAVSATELSLPLTFFDLFWLKFPPVERLFFYQIPHLTSQFFKSDIVPKLKQSLSITLFHYLPLAGNLMWPQDTPKPAIYYFQNDGVSLTVAESNADFNYLSGYGPREVGVFHSLIPQLSISDDKAAVIAIQITLFPDEGFSIGFSAHHGILDGKTSTMLLKSWAYICKQDKQDPSLPSELTPLIDRSVIQYPTGIDTLMWNGWFDSNPRSLKLLTSKGVDPNLLRATFQFSREDIKKLRVKVQEDTNQSEQLHLSSFVLTYAYVVFCLTKAIGKEEGEVLFGFTADYRTRLEPPIAVNYFGNCVCFHGGIEEAKDVVKEDGVFLIAKRLSECMKELEKGAVLEATGERLASYVPFMKQGAKGIGIAGSPRFEVYGTDFGWGRPKKVEIVSIDKNGSICLAESGDGSGGVEVGVVLEKQQMEVFASVFANGLQ